MENVKDFNFIPDWTAIWSPQEAEKKLEGFKWTGPGWYHRKGDTIIALPQGENLFRFCIYDQSNVGDAFNNVINLPNRLDERD